MIPSHTGRLLPEVPTLSLLYTIFDRKGDPFIYLSYEMVPLSHTPCRNNLSFFVGSVQDILKGPFKYPNDSFSYPLRLQLVKSYYFLYLHPEKGTPFDLAVLSRRYSINGKRQYNTIQYNTIQYNTIQYNKIQYNTIQYNTIQYNTILY